ncbi:MAG: hypothetical protein ACPGVK_12335 [Halocynthiibacter sp.]
MTRMSANAPQKLTVNNAYQEPFGALFSFLIGQDLNIVMNMKVMAKCHPRYIFRSYMKTALLIPIISLFALSACQTTSTQPSADKPATMAPVENNKDAAPEVKTMANASGKTQIVIYRSQLSGFAIQPRVLVDGRKTGTCSSSRSFTVNVTPGTHEIFAQTMGKDSIKVNAKAGTTTYVQCKLSIGLLVGKPKFTVKTGSKDIAKANKLKSLGTY